MFNLFWTNCVTYDNVIINNKHALLFYESQKAKYICELYIIIVNNINNKCGHACIT